MAYKTRLFTLVILTMYLLSSCGGDSQSGSEQLGTSLGLTSSNIEFDPFGTAPLSARLSFRTPVAGIVKLTVLPKGLDGIIISHQFSESATTFVLPVLGLYAEYNNSVVVDFVADTGESTRDVIEIATAPIALSPTIEIIQNELPPNDSSVFLFARQKAAFDQQGELRWVYRGEGFQFYRKLANGNFVADIDENAIGYHVPKFAEFSMLGEKIREYSVDNYFHHEVRKLPWGNYLVASNSSLIDFATNGVPEEDVLIEIAADTGVVVKFWDFNFILDPDRTPIPSNNRPDDWLHLNSAIYDATDNSIIITSQRQSLVAKIDYDTAELKWILGSHSLWTVTHQDKLLIPVDALGGMIDATVVDFWPYGPHAVLTHGNGAIAIFDNGIYRGWYEDISAPLESYSRGVEYLVDEDDMTVQIVWQYDADKQIFTAATGDIDHLGNNNYLIGYAGLSPDTPRIVEVDSLGNILFEAVFNRGEFDYRAEKINLYDGY